MFDAPRCTSRWPLALGIALAVGAAAAFGALPRPAAAQAPTGAGNPPPATRAPVTPAPHALGLMGRPTDYSSYQKLLDDYLSIVSTPGEPLQTRVDYESLYVAKDRDWRIAKVKFALLSANPSRMNAKARLAWGINTYNFLVIQAIAENFYEKQMVPVSSNGRHRYVRLYYESVNNIPINGENFFEAQVVQIEGVSYSLNTFERHFLFADYDMKSAKPVPKELDPRSHFAIVCGARGCPPLRPRVYLPDSLDAQLDEAARTALASPLHLQWEPTTHAITVSAIFAWYEADFGGPSQVVEFVERYAPEPLRTQIVGRKIPKILGRVPWDWGLNQTRMGGPGATPRSE